MNKEMILFELKQGMRNRWMTMTTVLFALLALALAAIQQYSIGSIEGYSRPMASLLNLILFVLSLFILALGSMSVAGEKESGWLRLIQTYPVRLSSWLIAKYIALVVSMFTVISIGFGGSLILTGLQKDNGILLLLFTLSVGMVLIFSSVAMLIGALAKNRLHALSMGLSLWAIFLLLLDYFLMAIGTFLPGFVLKNVVLFLTFINPASFIRTSFLVFSGNGSVLGPSFYSFVTFSESALGMLTYGAIAVFWIAVPLLIAIWLLGRRK